jgi:hypothetical protein
MRTLRKFYLKYILSTTNIQIPGWSDNIGRWLMWMWGGALVAHTPSVQEDLGLILLSTRLLRAIAYGQLWRNKKIITASTVMHGQIKFSVLQIALIAIASCRLLQLRIKPSRKQTISLYLSYNWFYYVLFNCFGVSLFKICYFFIAKSLTIQNNILHLTGRTWWTRARKKIITVSFVNCECL